MNQPHSSITNEPIRSDPDIVTPPQSTFDNAAPPPPATRKSQRLRFIVLVCLPIVLALLVIVGLIIVGLAKARDAADGRRRYWNVKAIAYRVNNVAGNSTTGDIPPAYGEFPVDSGKIGSFFYHLLPYIMENGQNLYIAPRDVPVLTYIAPADPRNPGTDGTISYASNGTLLSGKPRLPGSFRGRTSEMILVMERSGLDGAHKWTNTNNSLGVPGSPPPFPQFGVPPSAYLDGSPQGFPSVCVVGMGDGSARYVVQGDAITGWSWACDPADTRDQPPGW